MNDSRTKVDLERAHGLRLEDHAHTVLAGHGSGLPCAHCHQLIAPGEVEYEVITPENAAGSNAQPAPRLHLRCYDSWRANADTE